MDGYYELRDLDSEQVSLQHVPAFVYSYCYSGLRVAGYLRSAIQVLHHGQQLGPSNGGRTGKKATDLRLRKCV